MLEIIQLEVGLLQNFCEVIGCTKTGKAALVDPAFEVDRLLAAAEKRGWTVETILLTHTHDDHIAGLDEAATSTGATVYCHPYERDKAAEQAPRVEVVSDGQKIAIGGSYAEAIFTPGHTPGCICWHFPEEAALVTGDVLFVGSCGGVNYEDSDPRAMWDSLQGRLGALPEHTKIFPGHDYGETPVGRLAWERLHNPALSSADLAAFCAYKGVAVPD